MCSIFKAALDPNGPRNPCAALRKRRIRAMHGCRAQSRRDALLLAETGSWVATRIAFLSMAYDKIPTRLDEEAYGMPNLAAAGIGRSAGCVATSCARRVSASNSDSQNFAVKGGMNEAAASRAARSHPVSASTTSRPGLIDILNAKKRQAAGWEPRCLRSARATKSGSDFRTGRGLCHRRSQQCLLGWHRGNQYPIQEPVR